MDQQEPVTNQMRNLTVKIIVFAAAIIVGAALLVQLLTGGLGGATEARAFSDIFNQERPDSISNSRFEYFSHSKGYGYYLSFSANPEDLKSLFDAANATPMYVDEVILFDLWSAMSKFKKMHDGHLPDLKQAKIIVNTKPGQRREILLEPDSNQLFCFYLVDADIN